MASLKHLIDIVGDALCVTPAALYERQRVLVRAGLLEAAVSKGPGGGIQATPETVALLLTATLASSALSEVGKRTRQIASAKYVPRGKETRCPVSQATTFIEALVWAISSLENAKRSGLVTVSQTRPTASILFYRKSRSHVSVFGTNSYTPGIHISADLPSDSLEQVAQLLNKLQTAGAET